MSGVELLVSKDKFTVYVSLKENLAQLKINESDIYALLSKQGISFGIKRDEITKMIATLPETTFPLLIAEGEAPKTGEDGFIKLEGVEKDQEGKFERVLNFRNVREIPSVKEGQLIATIFPPTPGIPGKDVYGNLLKAIDGKPYTFKLGKNVVEVNGKIYATTDGQINISEKRINVLPVFEVIGDISLKTGNIDFIGNVTIKGNVPSDYIIKAGGDISIYGIVEGAELKAGGSIYISGGIVGFNRAIITAKNDIFASYLNQCTVNAGNNIEVSGSILHSTCHAKGEICSLAGSIIGGSMTTGSYISAKDVGNEHHTKTELYIGPGNSYNDDEKRITQEINEAKIQLQKVLLILQKLAEKYRITSSLSNEEILLLRRDKLTQVELTNKLSRLEAELNEIITKKEEMANYLIVTGTLFPNVRIQIGKYQKNINRLFHHVKVQLVNKEISITIFSENKK
ncbi:DUF342 domain-containing protein [Ferdinandcohnia sp. Marseille-Q9671]